MNVPSGILTLAAFGFCATSVCLYLKLDAARSEEVAGSVSCRDDHAQIAVLRQACGMCGPDVMQRKGFPADDLEDDSVEPAIGRLLPDTRELPLYARVSQVKPAGRESLRTRYEAALRWMYRGIGEELSLSPEQEAELLALLLEHQTEHIEMASGFAGDRTAMSHALNELRRGHTTQLMSALGDKYLELEGYQKSLGERMQINQAAEQLAAADVPLQEGQRTRLLGAMLEERDRLPRPSWTTEIAPQENIARQQAWHEAYEERVQDRATSILTSDQLKQYDVYRNLQAATRRRQLEAWQETARQPLEKHALSTGST